jgi:hypothetical protein
VGRLDHIDIEIAVEEDGASHRGDPDGPPLHAELIHGLGHEAMEGAVMAPRTEVGLDILETDRFLEDLLHMYLNKIF